MGSPESQKNPGTSVPGFQLRFRRQLSERLLHQREAHAAGHVAEADDEAVELLKGAGFEFNDDNTLSDETPIHLTYLTNDSDAHVKIAESMQQDFALIGVTMDIERKDWQVVLNERKEGQFDVAREGWLADYNDPINMLEMWLTNSGNNDMQFGR